MPPGTPVSNTTGCLGDGAACAGSADTAFQTINTISASHWKATTIESVPVLFASSRNASAGARLYKWQSAQNCFGDGSTCGVSAQTIVAEIVAVTDATTTSTGIYA